MKKSTDVSDRISRENLAIEKAENAYNKAQTAKYHVLYVSLYIGAAIAVLLLYSLYTEGRIPLNIKEDTPLGTGYIVGILLAIGYLILQIESYLKLKKAFELIRDQQDAEDKISENWLLAPVSPMLRTHSGERRRAKELSPEELVGIQSYYLEEIKHLNEVNKTTMTTSIVKTKTLYTVVLSDEDNNTVLVHIAGASAGDVAATVESLGITDNHNIVLVQPGVFELSGDGLSLEGLVVTN